MIVKFIDLKAQYLSIKDEIDEAIQNVLIDSAFTAGSYVKSFEEKFAKKHNARYCVGVNSGTAALHATLMALEINAGDEIIVPANTFFATPLSVTLSGATPVFVDCEPDYFNIDVNKIENAITGKTKAIIAVHLYGQPAQLDKIKDIADRYNLLLIEDCAQAHIAEYHKRTVGTFGICGCFSFYCGKNLGAYGEGGAIITNDETLYEKLLMIRNLGMSRKYHHNIIGHNYRMAGMQGAILDVKLKYLDKWTEIRRRNADLYRKYLQDCSEIILPNEMDNIKHVYHLFVIRTKKRDELRHFLGNNHIQTGIHYPIPCHLQKAYDYLNYKIGNFPITERLANEIISLPMSEQLNKEEIKYVSEKIREYYSKGVKRCG
ncbi:MAG: DegT/DnrJ/EryC1/StrS family aminotransferase [Armatimonadetes bacterium]|nr:DegT/DnrJ/EryC1/StrS family aminotransferase [Armatimonadota bacterium]